MAKKQSVYFKERKRVLAIIRRLNKQGYNIDLYFPSEKELKEQGIVKSEKTKLTRELKSLTPEYFRTFYKPEPTPEPTPEADYEEIPHFSDMVIENYIEQVKRFPPKVASIVLTALDRAIALDGKDVVAYRLETRSADLSEYLNNVIFFGDSVEAILAYCDAKFGEMPGVDDYDRIILGDISDSESYSD